jgi:cell division protease FtsH
MDEKFTKPGNYIKKPSDNGLPVWRIITWILVVWFAAVFFLKFYGPESVRIRNLSYSEFKQSVQEKNVAEITVKGDQISGKYVNPVKAYPAGVEEQLEQQKNTDNQKVDKKEEEKPEKLIYERFKTIKPPFEDSGLMKLLEKNNVTVFAESQKESQLWLVIVNILPWVLIIGFIIWSSKKFQERMGGGKGGGIFGFGKSKAKLFTRESVNVSYNDVAGLDNAKKELLEIVEFLKDPSRFQKLGGELPKGILLVGNPGVGKTLLAKATAGEADVPFYSISGSEFIEMFVGVGASRVRDMFKKAKEDAPSIIFIDELDSIGRVRGSGVGGGHDEREQTLNQILAEMDGFSSRESVVVMAATNRPDVLDPALVRPGRFDRQISLNLPRKKAREEILKIHTHDVPLAKDIDLEKIADITIGFSGADLENLVNEASLLAARQKKEKVDNDDFIQARDKIIMGIKREEVIEEDEKKIVAFHEAGHALMALLLPKADPLEKISIIPRGKAMGATEQIPEKERYNMSRQYLLNRIAVMLGGRAAEQLIFKDMTTGAADDLKKVTQLAGQMVCQWGMSSKLGPATYKRNEQHPFLGKEMTAAKDFSEHTAQMIDDEIRRILTKMEQLAMDTLSENKDKLEALTAALVEKETLSKEEVMDIIGSVEKVREVSL